MRALPAKLFLLLISFGVVALIAELALRIQTGQPVHYRYPQESYVHDALIGHRLMPGDRAYTHDQPVEINDQGLRSSSFTREIPSRTRRILAMGDSQTFGDGLALDETWPALLDLGLARRYPGWGWQVLNAGISGTSTWQHAHLLDHFAEHYELDAVILAFYVNDVTKRYTPAPAGDITNTLSKRVGYVLKRSALFTLLWQSSKRFGAGANVADHDRRMLRGEPDALVDAGWEQVELSLGDMAALCRARGIQFMIVVLPRRDQIAGDEKSLAYSERIAAIAARLDIPIVDTLSPLESAYAEYGNELFIPWDGHHTGRANEVIAAEIAHAFGDRLSGAAPTPP